MEKKVDQQLEVALRNYEEGCFNYPMPSGGCDAADSGGVPDPPTAEPDTDSSANEYSETNTQVAGVDEADFLKNDGAYIYILADNKFKIVDAWPAENAKIISSTEIEGTPKKLFVYENKALIYSSIGNSNASNYGYYQTECTYGYDCDFTGDGLMLKITVLDISDKATPKMERETLFSGSYLNSRRINDVVHTAVIFPEIKVEGLVYWPKNLPRCPEIGEDGSIQSDFSSTKIRIMFEELKKTNTKTINNLDITRLLPSVTDTRYIDGKPNVSKNLLADCKKFYFSQSPESKSFLSLVSQKIDQNQPLFATTIMGKPGAIYANSESLYVATRQYQKYFDAWYFDSNDQISEATTVHKFAFSKDGGGSIYKGSGVVKGRILNQFSMDERNDYLRIATTTGHLPDPNVHSTLLSLKEDRSKLVVAGEVDDIAPSEDIRSVRFTGDTVFIVTFKKTDPLFAFDFSDPENPVLKGELKIPGYSTYMHLMDETHLLTIGYDAEDQGNFAYFQGIMLQIFDISNLTQLALTHKEVIGTRGTTSDAATNHLAFNYFAPKNLLSLPMVVCEESSGGGDYGDMMTFSGLMVYKVTTDEGFEYLGGIAHEEAETEGNYRNACSNWWTRSNSIVKRSIIMDDYVYSVALDSINIARTDDLNKIISSVKLLE